MNPRRHIIPTYLLVCELGYPLNPVHAFPQTASASASTTAKREPESLLPSIENRAHPIGGHWTTCRY